MQEDFFIYIYSEYLSDYSDKKIYFFFFFAQYIYSFILISIFSILRINYKYCCFFFIIRDLLLSNRLSFYFKEKIIVKEEN